MAENGYFETSEWVFAETEHEATRLSKVMLKASFMAALSGHQNLITMCGDMISTRCVRKALPFPVAGRTECLPLNA